MAQNSKAMTRTETRNFKINWTLDKVLMGILVFLAIKTYGSIEDTVKTVQQLDKRTSLVEYRLTAIEHNLSK